MNSRTESTIRYFKIDKNIRKMIYIKVCKSPIYIIFRKILIKNTF